MLECILFFEKIVIGMIMISTSSLRSNHYTQHTIIMITTNSSYEINLRI